MKHFRGVIAVSSLLTAAMSLLAQVPPAAPAPPAPLAPGAVAPRVAPRAMSAPNPMPVVAPLPPLPPIDIDLGDLEAQVSMAKEMAKDMASQLEPRMREQMDQMRIEADRMSRDIEKDVTLQAGLEAARAGLDMEQYGNLHGLTQSGVLGEQMAAVRDQLSNMKMDLAFAPQSSGTRLTTPSPVPVVRANQAPWGLTNAGMFRNTSDEHLYSAGQSALDGQRWDQAIDYFGQLVTRKSPRADGALYWKAYALGKLGKREDAVAAIAELRKSYASSRWLDDAKALELELKQAAGQNVSPEAENDDELKLMAINGLMQSDPERAVPLLERQIKGSASPKVKRNALFVLAQSSSPKAQALIEQLARGASNPDLQVKAITYMGQRRKSPNTMALLAEIYLSTGDTTVKMAILQAFASGNDKERLLQAARNEKAAELKEYAIGALGNQNGTPELWQLYQAESTPEGKLQLLRYMHYNSNGDKLLEVVRTEKDPKVRVAAARALAGQKTGVAADTLVALYGAESDTQVKQSILDGLMAQRNAKALVDIARSEKDTKLKLRIVERLSNMKSKEAADYLEELLKK